MEANEKKLRETREKKIPELIEKYEKLADSIIEAVSRPMPVFKDIVDEDGAIKVSGEMQLFSFIAERKQAVDKANYIMRDINELEIELQCPEYLKVDNPEEESQPANTTPQNYAKLRAKKRNQRG